MTQSSSGTVSPDGSTVTWYFPDGTVAHQQYPMTRSEPSASSGSSFPASPGASSGSSFQSWSSESGASSGASGAPYVAPESNLPSGVGSDFPGQRPGETGTTHIPGETTGN